MKPKIEGMQFGSIIIDGVQYNHDVIIRLDGRIEKRKKKLSKAVYGTSHRVSLEEAKFIYEEGARKLITGTGQESLLEFSEEAAQFLESRDCEIEACPSRIAMHTWNQSGHPSIGLFHVTC